ncbi:MAG TPA: hypothetical protein VK627_06400 [Edaphobacter sp.]|jgi:hypothetical protein|nr:hypothetical protein [Edaphobacter sp.]
MKEVEAYPGATPEELKLRKQQLKQHIATSTEIPEELKPLIADRVDKGALLEVVYERAGKNIHFYGMQLGWKHWAIKNDNLKLLETLSTAAIAIATFIAVPAAAPAVLAVTLLFSSVAVSERLRTKSVSLEPEQYRLLMALKACGPISAEQLAEKLSGIHLFGSNVWTESRTLEALKALQLIHLRDGTTESLVTQANTGLWSTNGI